MGKVLQSSFKGGIRQDIDPTKVSALGDAYFLGVNIRTSKDVVEPIKSPKDLTSTVPAGKLQGIFSARNYILLFVDGLPYYKDFSDESSGFRRLGEIQALDKTVDYIYTEFVPGSTLGFGRVLAPIKNSDGTITTKDNVSIVFDSETIPYKSSSQGVIIQDGVSRPQLILDDGTVRELSGFEGWTLENREFVPTGKMMLWAANGILYTIKNDGLEIFHSVTGRPLDNVICIDEDGNKLISEDESANTHKVDYEIITGIKTAPVQDSFVITTKNKTFLVTALLTEEDLEFGEPTFATIQVSSVGAVNHLCFADLGGDTGIINPNGIHSFNAASVTKQESEVDPISKVISSMFKLDEGNHVKQDYPCATEFGADFALFAVNTIYGRGVLVYDKTIEKFVSLDIYAGVAQIKQFAQLVVNGERRLFFITVDNKFYEAFAGDTYETSGIIPGEWSSDSPSEEQKPLFCHLVFNECETEGMVSVTPIVNRVHGNVKREALKITTNPKELPIEAPFGGGTKDTSQIVDINLSNIQRGWKIGCWIQWNVKAKLTHISLDTESSVQEVNSSTKARRYANNSKS